MKIGVESGTCGFGARFHDGIGGRSNGEVVAAASAKLLFMGVVSTRSDL